MSFAFVLLTLLPSTQGFGQLQPARVPDPALYRRHLVHERQASCFNDLITGQPQSCIASASCCRGVRFSTCVRNGDVCCDFGNSMGSCPAGYLCMPDLSGQPACEPPNSGGDGGGNGGNGDDDGEEEKDEATTSEEVDSTTTSFEDTITTSPETTSTTSPIETTSEAVDNATTTAEEESDVTSSAATASETVNEQHDSGSSTLTQAKLAGIIISIIAALCGIIFGIVKLIMKHRKHKKKEAARNMY